MKTLRILMLVAALWIAGASTARAAPAATLREVLGSYPGDSLARPLRRLEQDQAQSTESGDAALTLGRFHFARGEYRQASDTFARAAARLSPGRKSEARYWAGLSALALKQPEAARALLEEVVQSGSPRRSDAMLGVALAWEMAGRMDAALTQLDALLAGDAGEAGPAALEHAAALATRMGRSDQARRASDRLLKSYPRSIEAARIQPSLAAASAAAPVRETSGATAVQIGAFADPSRARALAERARLAGFPGATVVTRGEGAGRTFAVRIGSYASRDEARRAGERAASGLGVSYRLEKPQ